MAERMNKILNEHTRSMRLHARLPKIFWADAVSTTAYLINRGPLVPMEFRLPEEVWSGKEVKFSHVKVFVVFLMFILILLLVVNFMQSPKFVF